MTMLLDRSFPSTPEDAESESAFRLVRLHEDPCRRIENQAAKTLQAFERLHRSETKLKTNATQILLAILRYAAAQDDPAD